MNPYVLSALVVLGAAATIQYFFGTKKNKVISSTVSSELEAVLKPRDSNYVNIGGSIGYNFAYALSDDFSKAKGTMTVRARHSLLYLPLSLLFGVQDRMFVNIFTKKRLRAEGHIVKTSYLKRANIEGLSSMSRENAKGFTLLWRGSPEDAEMAADLKRLYELLPEPERLRHFCVYPETKTFFIYLTPKNGHVKAMCEAIMSFAPRFIE